MDDRTVWKGAVGRAARGVVAAAVLSASGCGLYVGTTAKSFMKHVRANPDPNARYLAYSKLGDKDLFETPEERAQAVAVLIDRYKKGKEPLASRAMICRTLGELGDPAAREVLLAAVAHPEGVVKIEACRALGKVGKPEDATVLARIMMLDPLEDARIAAIDGLAALKSDDPRIYKMLLDAMEHDDPAMRLGALNALRAITGKDLGVEVEPWRKELEPILAATPADMAEPSTAGSPADEAAAKSLAVAGSHHAAAPPPSAEPKAAEPEPEPEPEKVAAKTDSPKADETEAAVGKDDDMPPAPLLGLFSRGGRTPAKPAAESSATKLKAQAKAAAPEPDDEDAGPKAGKDDGDVPSVPFFGLFTRGKSASKSDSDEAATKRAREAWERNSSGLRNNGSIAPNR